MIFLKIFFTLIIILNIYFLTITKKKSRIDLLKMNDNIGKIKSLVKFKNTEDVRAKCISNVSQFIQRKRIAITFFILNRWIPPVIYLLLMKVDIVYLALFLIRVAIFFLIRKFEINKICNTWYKMALIIEIILLVVILYG